MTKEDFDRLVSLTEEISTTLKEIEEYLKILVDFRELSKAGPQASTAENPFYYDDNMRCNPV